LFVGFDDIKQGGLVYTDFLSIFFDWETSNFLLM